MSRTTSAVDMAPVSGLPVVEHALPIFFAALTYDFSSFAPHGKATLTSLSTSAWSLVDFQHRTFSLDAMPRGSTPTMSNRSSSAGLRKDGAARAARVDEQAADPVFLVPGLDPQHGDLGRRPLGLVVVQRQPRGGAFGGFVALVPAKFRRGHVVDALALRGAGLVRLPGRHR